MNTKLLVKYLANECNNEEIKAIRAWLSEDSENEKTMRDIERIWEVSAKKDAADEKFNTELDWAVLQHRIEDKNLISSTRTIGRDTILSLNSSWAVAARVAAIFILAALVGTYTYKTFYIQPAVESENIFREITMAKGQRGGVTLSDGTKVYLNSDSKISIPNVFANDLREVHLEGEAYFDVAKNPNRPFIIKVDGAVVQVLGTSFTVRSYAGEGAVQTVVEEGVVSFRAEGKTLNEGVILTKGKLGRLNLASKEIVKETVDDLELYLSWKEGYLKFNEATMKEVARQLERKYDIEVSFATKEIADLRLTAELKSRSINSVLQTISISLGLQYKLDNDKVKFSNLKEGNHNNYE
ncbi:MAG: FecR domain-containing protein [Balneolaceae bacterium]